MARLRDPETLCDVVAQFRALLGAEEAARLIGRSASVIHRSADPDDEYMLSVIAMLQLDAACAEKGATPFMAFQQRALALVHSKAQDVPLAFLEAEEAMGRLAGSLRASMELMSDYGSGFSANEAMKCKQAVARLIAELNDVMKSITAQQPDGKTKASRRK